MARSLIVVAAMSVSFHAVARGQAGDGDGGGGGRNYVWGAFGLGYGVAAFSCDTCRSGPRLGGWIITGDLGWIATPHVLVGAELRCWSNGSGRAGSPGIGSWTGLVSYYPRVRGGPFVEGGVGLTDYVVAMKRDTAHALGAGWGFTLGAGWEVPRGAGAGTVRMAYDYGYVGALRGLDRATVATGWKERVLLVEVAIRGAL